MVAVEIGEYRRIGEIVARVLGINLDDNEYIEGTTKLFSQLFPSVQLEKIKTYALNPDERYFAIFSTIEEAAEFKLRHL